jgi:hypothetical protein
MEIELCESITVNGWDFELVNNDTNDRFYQCRGAVYLNQVFGEQHRN